MGISAVKQTRCIIDSNFLQNPALREYLSRIPTNTIVLTDYAWMEAYKGDTLRSIFNSMAILSEFPKRVILLKGTRSVGALSARSSGLAERMIRPHSTREFAEFCRDLRAARGGDHRMKARLIEHGQNASEHIEQIMKDAERLLPIFQNVATNFTADEIGDFRASGRLSRETTQKVIALAGVTARDLMQRHPGVKDFRPPFDELKNSYMFRHALCGVLLVLRWIRTGSQKKVKPEKLRNDLLDLTFAAYGTYFDGLLTHDSKLAVLHAEARLILRLLKAVVPKGNVCG